MTENSRHLFLGGVAYKATEQDIRTAIEDEGISVDNVRLGVDHDTGRSRGFAFVDISASEPRSLADLITTLTGIMICGRACRVEMVNEKPPRSPNRSAHARSFEPPRNERPRRRDRFERAWRDND